MHYYHRQSLIQFEEIGSAVSASMGQLAKRYGSFDDGALVFVAYFLEHLLNDDETKVSEVLDSIINALGDEKRDGINMWAKETDP